MNDIDPGLDPRRASVIGHDTNQPYARRSVRAVFGFVLGLIALVAFIVWFFFFNPDNQQQSSQNQIETTADASMPGNEYDEGSSRNAIYDFFYTVFSGIEDGIEDSPHNLENMEELDDLNIDGSLVSDTPEQQTLAAGQLIDNRKEQLKEKQNDAYDHSVYDVVDSEVYDVNGKLAGNVYDIVVHKETGEARAIIVNQDNARYERELTALNFKQIMKQREDGEVIATITEERIENKSNVKRADLGNADYISLRHLRDGQIIDDQGQVAGSIDAIIYNSAEAQNIFFSLRPALSNNSLSTFKIAFEEANIVKNADGYDIRLSKQQTERLAKILFGDNQRQPN